MLKTTKYRYISPAYVRMAAILLLFFVGGRQMAVAQGDTVVGYTLTNGNLWWLDGFNPPRNQDETNRYVRGWDKSQSGKEIYKLGSHEGQGTTLVTSQGDIYLALNLSYDEHGDPVASIGTRLVEEVASYSDDGRQTYNNTTQGFSPYCVWFRTNGNSSSSTGYFYQDWVNPYNGKTYRYYLNCNSSGQLEVYVVPEGAGMNPVTYWYDWDYGAAMSNTTGTGTSEEKTEYYWISLDTAGHEFFPEQGSWKVSGDSYQRPDEIIYNPYRTTESQNTTSYYYIGTTPNMTFYDNRVLKKTVSTEQGTEEINDRNVPNVMPAAVLPVTVYTHEREILSTTGGINGFLYKYASTDAAMTQVDVHNSDGTLPEGMQTVINLVYGDEEQDSIIVEPNIVYTDEPNKKVTMDILPEYRLCTEEKYRRGINMDYTKRNNAEFGSAGIVEEDNYYYWPNEYNGEWVKHNIAPIVLHDDPTIDSIVPSVDNRSRRYLRVDVSANNSGHNYRLKVIYAEPSAAPLNARIIATVYYSNGAIQKDTLNLYLRFTHQTAPAVAKHAPVIRGSVYGGGRVANVGFAHVDDKNTVSTDDDELVLVGGNTHITVHSTDSIYAVYGGNDIAGWVEGSKGATIQIGTELTDEEHPVSIGWAYGGGCGYYRYSGVYDANTTTPTWGSTDTKVKGLGYGQYCFNGKVYDWVTGELVHDGPFDYEPYTGSGDFAIEENGLGKVGDAFNGTIPYIRTSHTTVGISDTVDDFHYLHNDYIYVDSLFGGAENAFIGITSSEASNPHNGVTIDVNGGTMMTLFGGNNYGGSVAQTSTVFIDVWNTKLTDEESTENTYYGGYGRDFGIRHLFGGGNFVEGSHANVRIHGGMLDTVFLGGNRATVDRAYGTVECLREYEKKSVDDGHGSTMLVNDFTKPIIDRFGNIGHFIWTNPTTDTTHNCINTSIEDWEGDAGRYNIRCLFGGNNNADMDEVALIQLHSGGISSVYGGGNAGDMNNDDPISEMPALYRTLLGRAFEGWDGTVPGKVGSIVAALHDSKIICEYVYGGCRQANVKNSCGIYAAGGAFGYINGGNDVSGDVGSTMPNGTRTVPTGLTDPATIEIGTAEGTYVVCDSNVVIFGDIYAGSDGYLHCDDGTGRFNEEDLYDTYSWVAYDEYHDHIGKLIPTHNHTNLYLKGGIVRGNVYSGGINANVGFSANEWPYHKSTDPWSTTTLKTVAAGEKNGRVHTVISGGEVDGQVFGGGFMSSIYGTAYLHIKGSPVLNEVYAGNDVTGSIETFERPMFLPPSPAHPSGIAAEDFYNSIGKTEGSGTEVDEKNSLNRMNKYSEEAGKWEGKYSTYVLVEGTPRIETLYGSGNGSWNYDGTRPQYDEVSICEKDLTTGARPHQASAFLDIHTSGGYINTVFGGGNGAGVREDNLVILLNNTTNFNESDVNMEGLAADILSKEIFVGTIFGGNNFDPMTTCVPNIRLEKGCVKNVYGGSNSGIMGWHTVKTDAKGDKVTGVTTYVKVESENATITDSLFGGCRMSDVQGLAYVDVRSTTSTGINYLYGGNDISGNIDSNTRVDINGGVVHHIWGGSNGRYDFMAVGDNEYKIYPFGTIATGDTLGKLITIAAKPDVDSAQVHLWGGIIDRSVFAGGSMADCRATYLDIDDHHVYGTEGTNPYPLTIQGAVYGGGEGYWEDLNAERRGNVTENTDVHLRHAENITQAKAYGGGRGGDVRNTNITTYTTWDKPFDELYGGCWGSDVLGTAHLEFEGVNLVKHLFGGNDFTGNVYRSLINVRSGKFKNIYGGGNGTYPDSYYTNNHPDAIAENANYANVYATRDGGATYALTKPNSEYIEINVYDGLIDSCIYGGGRQGTVMTYKRLPNGNYDLASRKPGDPTYPLELKQPDTTLTNEHAHQDPTKYAYIIYNMHGGTVNKNIFAGGCGDYNDVQRKPIVYGLKTLNMDGGYIGESVYGGSEFVNDGYAAECKAYEDVHPTATNISEEQRLSVTTRRPSSIVNVTGGTINGFLYGAGYLGDVYGSTYINVGKRAIDTCMAFRRSYATSDTAYRKFMPGAKGSLVPNLTDENDLFINHSIYGGANWGTNTGNTSFTKESYHGGESRVIVDGHNYKTAATGANSSGAAMNIRKSIIGSGTSALGGDLVSDIVLRDYGGVDNCATSKQLESIQRSDSMLFHRSAVELTGASDAEQAFVSENYSIKNIGSLGFRGYNVVQLDATVDEVAEMNVYKEDRDNTTGKLVHTTLGELNTNVIASASATDACDDMCEKTGLVDYADADRQKTMLVLNEGIDMYIKSNNNFGPLNGYSYVTTPAGYSSTIAGLSSGASGTSYNHNVNNGYGQGYDGFVATCDSKNKYISGGNTNHGTDNGPTWVDAQQVTGDLAEHPFINYTTASYRVWNVGEGIRKREAAILAHTVPDSLPTKNVAVKYKTTLNNVETRLGLAQTHVTLPASSPNSYYMFDGDFGFVLDGENAPLNLVDSAWLTTVSGGIYAEGTNPCIRNYHKPSAGTNYYTYEDDGSHGSWAGASLSEGATRTGVHNIMERPNNTFALIMVPEDNFATGEGSMPTGHTSAERNLVITGNSYVNASESYCTPKVSSSGEAVVNVLPTMKFYMLYDTSFTSTFLGSVRFRLNEYNSAGTKTGIVEIELFISTIISDFTDIEDNVLAMCNNGRSNKFTRKIMLPAVMEERDLYLTDVTWVPTDGNGNAVDPSSLDEITDRFYLMPDVSDVVATSDDYPKDRQVATEDATKWKAKSHNRFAMTVVPGEDLSSDITAVLGWNNVSTEEINVYRLANATGNTPDKITKTWETAPDPDTASRYVLHTEDATRYPSDKGLLIGTLNGRGSTVFNVNLFFDGERMYDKIEGLGYVGKVVMGFNSYHQGSPQGRFTLTIYVKTRENGDTIYVASASDYVERDGVKAFPFTKSEKYYNANDALKAILLGKSPNCYVYNFQQALSSNVYQEGDVIAILDTVKINNGKSVFIQGADGPPIEVIRYDGHHHEFPGEGCVYRGPMIQAKGNGTVFSARNIAFHGGAGAKVKNWPTGTRAYWDGVDGRGTGADNDQEMWADHAHSQRVPYGSTTEAFSEAEPDTNAAFGPIIQATNGATVYLADGTTMMYNWNAYGSLTGQHADNEGDDLTSTPRNMGAISLTNKATLKLKNDVTIRNNFSHTFDIDDRDNRRAYSPRRFKIERPSNGAIYIDDAYLELEGSNELSSITITDNYLMDPYIHGTIAQQEEARWWTYYPNPTNPTRWVVDPQFFNDHDWPHANVYLTRTKRPSSGKTITADTMYDGLSDHIIVSGGQSATSRIGVRKWFPGLQERDTIKFATYSNGDNSVLSTAMDNGVFVSDDDQKMFYNIKVNNSLAYLERCVTFQHQHYIAGSHETIDPLYEIDINSTEAGVQHFTAANIKSSSPLKYNEVENTCPDGGDTLFYHLQGGFAPYTYTWTNLGADGNYGTSDDEVMATVTTPHANTDVQKDLDDESKSETQRLEKYLASVADTLYLPYARMENNQYKQEHNIRVSATDVTGNCTLHKDIKITIDRHWEDNPHNPTGENIGHLAPVSYIDHDKDEATLANWDDDPSDGWTDTNRTMKAIAKRNYRSIHVVPKVWVDRNSGVISAVVAGDDNDHIYEFVGESDHHELSDLYFCDGDIVMLRARTPYTEVTPNTNFIMWDFDPYYSSTAIYVVPAATSTVTAYYGPDEYWKDHINTTAKAGSVYDDNYYYNARPTVSGYTSTDGTGKAGFVTTYNGDVHIYDENGLAWFISVVNGLNGTQAREFYFNYVYIHQKADDKDYDMGKYRWTPVGSHQHAFRGRLVGVGKTESTTEPAATPVVIKNIILDEPSFDNVGFFAYLDKAQIKNIKLQSALVRGSQYVGTLAARSQSSKIDHVDVADDFGDDLGTTTILASHYASGGMLGRSYKDTVTNATVEAKYVGDAVYSGGVVGYGESSAITNSVGRNDSRMGGLYIGGLAGYLDGTAPVNQGLFRRKSAGEPSILRNNYVHVLSNGNSQRVGGIVGYSKNTVIENNYVYGVLEGETTEGGVAALADEGTQGDHNYYAAAAANHAAGQQRNGAQLNHTASFDGKGNQVTVSQPMYGIDNLTRILNRWVKEHGDEDYRTWRSDLEGKNGGYPVFGEPDMIPVRNYLTFDGCDSIVIDGTVYSADSVITVHVIDSIQMIDSTSTIAFIVHHSTREQYLDSATVGESYDGYGFSLSAAESELLRESVAQYGFVTIQLTDTLSSAVTGCDSIVSLVLTLTAVPGGDDTAPSQVIIYPNPTISIVNIEAKGLERVELYDNEGRLLQDYTHAENDHMTINVGRLHTGVYYLRVHNSEGVSIQKLIKQ